MKKIILTVAIVCAAAMAQAASVTWTSTKLFTAASAEGGFSSTAIGKKATGYLFLLTEAQYNDFLADYTTNGNMAKVYNTYKDSLGSANATGTSGSRNSTVAMNSTANVDDTVYGAVIYTYTDADLGKDFYIANIATGTVGSEAGISLGNLGTNYLGDAVGASTGGWVATPEPTSGLLLLLGMAGLALKRKNA